MTQNPENHVPFPVTVTGSGPALLLVPGAGGRANFAPVHEALAERHVVIAPEYPGSGGTPRAAEPLTVDGMVGSLIASATRAGFERFTVVGFSLGSVLALRLAAHHPERVDGVVITAGLARPDNRVRLFVDLSQSLLAGGDIDNQARFVALNGLSPAFVNQVPDDQLPGLVKTLAATADPAAVDHTEVVRHADVTADLGRVAAPTLIVNPVRDSLVVPDHSRRLAAGIPGAREVELDAGHLALAERPREWLGLVSAFLDEHGL